MTMKHPELYDIRDCKNKTAEACVWHHHDNVNCNFNTGRSEGGQSLNNRFVLDSILEHYGYSINKKNCKKPHSLILINLVSPKLNYRSYGKSRIDFSPFASAIAETTIKACMGGGRGSDGKPAKNSVLLDILRDRKDKWESMDPMERIKNWWTMSDVFYATRKKLIDYGYTNDEINRNYITNPIKRETGNSELS